MPTIRIYGAELRSVPLETACLLLDRRDRQRANAIRHPSARGEFIRTRALLRMALARCTGGHPGAFEFATGGNGKPHLARNQTLQFNVSHAGGRALIAVAPCPVGIDIERTDEQVDYWDVASSVMSPSECHSLLESPEAQRREVFFSLWTRKEAYLKATGLGFSCDPRLISSVSPDGSIKDHSQHSGSSRWYAFNLPGPETFKAALVAPSHNPDILIEDISEILRRNSGTYWNCPAGSFRFAGVPA